MIVVVQAASPFPFTMVTDNVLSRQDGKDYGINVTGNASYF